MPDLEYAVIRRYQPKDRQAIRTLCCDTAYFGNPCEAFFSDRELLADLVMNYHTDYEPEHAWLVEHKGEVVAYLCACFNEVRYSRRMLFKIVPFAFVRSLMRGKIWSKKTRRLISYNFKCFFSGEIKVKKLKTKKFPVNIHQNTKQGFRGRGLGKKLVAVFLKEVEKNKMSGIRFRALRQEPNFLFFEKYGFKKIDCKRVKIWEEWLKKTPLYYMEYGKPYLL